MATGKLLALVLFVNLAVVSQGQKVCPGPPAVPPAPAPLCSGNFANRGNITSPNYPSNYPDQVDCTYTLTASNGFIQLTFNDFDLETNWDFLAISSDGSTIGRYTGATRPPVLMLGRTVTLHFTSDFCITRRGFHVTFETITANCGGLVAGSGTIRSTNNPSTYLDNQVCVWGVVATQGKIVTLDFQSFNIESYYDWLELYEGKTLVARYTGSSIPPRANLGPSGRVVFTSDSSIENSGFSIAAASADPICGGPISGAAVITSPNYPSNYPSSTSCTWTYRPSSNAVATRLSFTAFTLENNYDYVRIYDDEILRSSYTGSSLPKVMDLRSRTITVIFTSDINVEYAGFRLQFTPVIIS